MKDKQNMTQEEYSQLKDEILKDIIEYTKTHLVSCKVCGQKYKEKHKPLLKTEDGYICSDCIKNKKY